MQLVCGKFYRGCRIGCDPKNVIKLVIKIRSDELTTLMSQPPEDDDGDGIGDLNAVQKMLGTIREVFRDAVF